MRNANLFHTVEQKQQAFRASEQPSAFRSVDHALEVLCAFAEKEELGISDLARRLNLQKSGVHRIVRALALKGFVQQRANRRYSLGLRVLELGNMYRLRLDLARNAEPILRPLSQRTNANVHLARMENSEVFDLLRVEYPTPLRVTRSPMLRRPAHCTALGKVLLAYGPEEQLDSVLRRGLSRMTSKTITQADRLHLELGRIRDRGYAVDDEEFYPGIRCIAAPVFDEDGTITAAMSVSGLITHVTEDRVPQFAEAVMHAAGSLSEQLGFRRAQA
jgi:DNA-binding IclR family transcriptional regulator